MRYLFALIALALAHTGTLASAAPPAMDWEIGPIIRGQNYSVNMPPTPMQVMNLAIHSCSGDCTKYDNSDMTE